MIRLKSPDIPDIRRFLNHQGSLNRTFEAAGFPESGRPAGFDVDHNRRILGSGAEVFERAVAALRNWRQFELGWVQAGPRETPIEVGQAVAIWAKSFGLWWINACQIVSVTNDTARPVKRFGFSYVTLPGHMECGVERFLVEWNLEDDKVTYDILAWSHPMHWAARLAYRLMRSHQKRFARESMEAMQRAVQGGAEAATALSP